MKFFNYTTVQWIHICARLRRMELIQGWKLSLYAHFEIERKNSLGIATAEWVFFLMYEVPLGFIYLFDYKLLSSERIVMFICTHRMNIFSLSLSTLLVDNSKHFNAFTQIPQVLNFSNIVSCTLLISLVKKFIFVKLKISSKLKQ